VTERQSEGELINGIPAQWTNLHLKLYLAVVDGDTCIGSGPSKARVSGVPWKDLARVSDLLINCSNFILVEINTTGVC
jgi:hypothetical protein